MTLAARFAAAGLDWIVPDWDAGPRVRAFATTRNAGPRDEVLPALDLGPSHPERADPGARKAVLQSRARAMAFLPSAPIWLEQVHGRDVAMVDARTVETFRATPPVADAAVTRLASVPLCVRVADCLPVFLADRAGTVVGVAHAGWRGLAAGVLEATVAAMNEPADAIIAWIGPGIGPRAFEVGDEVREAFVANDRDASAHFAQCGAGKWLADLPALARRRLSALRVAEVRGGEHCTHADATRFHSWRRDRTAARMGAFVWLAV